MGRPRRKAPYHHGDLRRLVLEASLALVSEKGIGGLSMREVARRAGTTHGAPYHHFESRAAILATIAKEGFELLEREMRAACACAALGDPLARFEASGRAYFRFAVAHTAHFRVMFRPELADPHEHPDAAAASAGAFNVLDEIVAECQKSGLAPRGPTLPLVLTTWSTAHGLAALWVDGPLQHSREGLASDPEALASTVAHTLSGMLAAAGARDRDAF